MGKPVPSNVGTPPDEYIVGVEPTQGSEPSQYLEEKKEKFDSLSSGERNGNSPNRVAR
jgi:hypothetical protein